MKKRWFGRPSRRVRGAARAFAALVLAAVLMAAPAREVTAAVDVTGACILTVTPGAEEFADDLSSASVVFDLYQVAELLPLANSDGFRFGAAGAYAGLELPDTGLEDAAQWRAAAQDAAAIALAGDRAERPAYEGTPLGTPLTVAPGLYLMVARGSDIEEYVKTETNEDGQEELATIAHSRTKVYTFSPEFIVLPTKQAEEDGYIGTDSPGDWIYDLTVQVKARQSERYGGLEIVKSLDRYETKDPATFVFQVDGYTDESREELIYSDVVSLTFTEPGTQSALIEGRIPVGTYVVVTEVYSGASYELATPDGQTAVIEANEVVPVRFSNTYDEHNRGGGSITNRFTYGEDGSWQWTPSPAEAAQ